MNEEIKPMLDPMPYEFISKEGEAEFWDTHDIADYWHELKPVKPKFRKILLTTSLFISILTP